MRKSKKDRLEEYHTGKTTDLRNVVAEIQKVDQETGDLRHVVEEAQQIDSKIDRRDRESLLTCRLLFSSIYDKIFLFILIVGFLITSYFVFQGNIFGGFYGFWMRLLKECGVLAVFAILYFLFDWIYHCAIKTMMCVTKSQIYIERYFPFWRKELSIPLEHVTSISAIHFLLIFRCVIIFQYHVFPVVFFTWNSRKFKNKVMGLLGEKNPMITNYYDDTGILSTENSFIIRWFVVLFFMVLIILGVIHFFSYVFSKELSIAGKYKSDKNAIELKMDGSCRLNINSVMNKVTCTWSPSSESDEILMVIEQEKVSIPYKDDVILYGGIKYKKS